MDARKCCRKIHCPKPSAALPAAACAAQGSDGTARELPEINSLLCPAIADADLRGKARAQRRAIAGLTVFSGGQASFNPIRRHQRLIYIYSFIQFNGEQ